MTLLKFKKVKPVPGSINWCLDCGRCLDCGGLTSHMPDCSTSISQQEDRIEVAPEWPYKRKKMPNDD